MKREWGNHEKQQTCLKSNKDKRREEKYNIF